jgi:hypothetical protein
VKPRLPLALTVLLLAACSSGNAVVLAAMRGPVAVVPFSGINPDRPEAGLVPLIAVASFRGNELRLIDPSIDAPIAGPNIAYALAVPTLPRPTYLASGSLKDGKADVLVVASSGEQVQLIGTWLDGTNGFGVVSTWDLTGVAGLGAQVLSLAVASIPSGPATGTPPVAATVPGQAWVLVGFSDPQDVSGGQLVVLEVARQPDGSIALAGPATVKPLGFSPVAMAVAPDNVHIYFASRDVIRDSTGRAVLGVAEVDASAGLTANWPVRGLDARNAPTYTVAAAFVGERTQDNFYTFDPPALRVYAALDPSGCGPERDIACGVATFDPALGGLAPDPAPPGPPGSTVPTQSYRTPLFVPSQTIAMGIGLPPAVPGSIPPGATDGSQVCFSPAVAGNALPLCPSVVLGYAPPAPFNGLGAAQPFMFQAPTINPLWTSVTALVTAIDGLAYVQDLGRFGPVNGVLMVNSPATQTSALNAFAFGPPGPTANSPFFGFPEGTAAVGLWQDYPASGSPTVVYDPVGLNSAIIVWPGFTRTDHWRVSYQGVLPGLVQRRSVLGLAPGGGLYLAIQDALAPAIGGRMPASSEWVTGAVIASPGLGVHALDTNGAPGDLGLFLLDVDPCASTRPNWLPTGQTSPVYDPTKEPKAHEAVLAALLPPDPILYPGGGMLLAPADDPAMASEYACLVAWFQSPENSGAVLTAFGINPTTTDYARGTTLRAGGFVVIGELAGYAGRPQMDGRFNLAWSDEAGVSGEALVLARKARRYYYPAAYPAIPSAGFPEMTDPMQPGPALGFRVGRYCPTGVAGCNPLTSPPARDTGVDFFTRSGLEPMSRHPSNTGGGNAVTSFDKSVIPGLEKKGRVFYSTFVGDALMMVPPGLDATQTFTIR